MRNYLNILTPEEQHHLLHPESYSHLYNSDRWEIISRMLVEILKDKGEPTHSDVLKEIFQDQTSIYDASYSQGLILALSDKVILESGPGNIMLPGVNPEYIKPREKYFASYNFEFHLKEQYKVKSDKQSIRRYFNNYPLSHFSHFDMETGNIAGQFEGMFSWSDKLEIFQNFYYSRRSSLIYEGNLHFVDLAPDADGEVEVYYFKDGQVATKTE